MEQIRLGQTELQVSRIAFGTWACSGDRGAADVDEAKASIHRALELGINLFDTAQGYGFGAAERLLGEALWERARREDVVIAAKGGLRMEGDRLLRDAGARWLREGVESSLRSLGTDYIDIYHVHWPDLHTPPEETAGALEELVGQGKIRHVGVSNYDVGQMEALRPRGPAGDAPASLPPVPQGDRGGDSALVRRARPRRAGLRAAGPRAAVGPDAPVDDLRPDDWRAKSPDFTGETFRRNLAVVERLKGVADRRGISLPQLAVAWTLANPAVHVAIVGARRPSQLEGTAPAADVQLSESDLKDRRDPGGRGARVGPAPRRHVRRERSDGEAGVCRPWADGHADGDQTAGGRQRPDRLEPDDPENPATG